MVVVVNDVVAECQREMYVGRRLRDAMRVSVILQCSQCSLCLASLFCAVAACDRVSCGARRAGIKTRKPT